MLTKDDLPRSNFKPFRPNRVGRIIKYGILLVLILAGLYFAITYFFAQKIADKDLKTGQGLQSADKCKDAISNFKGAAKRSKKNNPTFVAALNGLWGCNQADVAKNIADRAYQKNPNNNISDWISDIEISKFSVANNKATSELDNNDKSQLKELIKKSSSLSQIAYQAIYENQISVNDQKYSDLVNKINSTANLKTKIIIMAQFLNENDNPAFGVDLAETVKKTDGQYRDALITLGYGYLKIGRLNDAENALESAAKINPVYAPTFELLTEVYKRQGKTTEENQSSKKAQMLK